MTLSTNDLDRELNEPMFQPLPTVGVRLVSIMDDSLLHAGQMAYIRRLRQGKDWQKYQPITKLSKMRCLFLAVIFTGLIPAVVNSLADS